MRQKSETYPVLQIFSDGHHVCGILCGNLIEQILVEAGRLAVEVIDSSWEDFAGVGGWVVEVGGVCSEVRAAVAEFAEVDLYIVVSTT